MKKATFATAPALLLLLLTALGASADDPPKPNVKLTKPPAGTVKRCLPDLVPVSVTTRDTQPTAEVTVVIKNQGCAETKPLPRAYRLGLNMSLGAGTTLYDVWVMNGSSDAVPPGATRTFKSRCGHTLAALRLGGTWVLRVDPEGAAAESDEQNNTASYRIQ